MENEGLIISHKQERREVRYSFAYNKFSDHLIVRYVLREHLEDANKPNAFKEGQPLYNFIVKNQNDYGLLEALYIQVPEYMYKEEKKELFLLIADFKEKVNRSHFEAFVKSLFWRRPDTIDDLITDIVARNFRQRGFEDVIVELLLQSGLRKDHSLNANFTNSLLKSLSLSERDSLWTVEASNRMQGGAIDRFLKWSASITADSMDKESLRLMSLLSMWLQASSNRGVRDTVMLNFVRLLSSSPHALKVSNEVFDNFKQCNDPYVADRLAMFIYAVVVNRMHAEEKSNLSAMVERVYKYYYTEESDNMPVSIIAREYIVRLLEVASSFRIAGGFADEISKLIIDPYADVSTKPDFLDKAPSQEDLKAAYEPDYSTEGGDREFSSIWGSVMGLGDFKRYAVDSSVNCWTARRKDLSYTTLEEKVKKFYERLNRDQKTLWREMIRIKQNQPVPNILESLKRQRSGARDALKKSIENFKNSLKGDLLEYYDEEIKNYAVKINPTDPLDDFDAEKAGRWIFNRVIELGWSYDLHGEYDDRIVRFGRRSRYATGERIGKKYQRIALHELLARISDNYHFKGFSRKEEKYSSIRQLHIREIDLTFITDNLQEHIFSNYFLKSALNYDSFTPTGARDNNLWLQSLDDLPNPLEFIEAEDDQGVDWLLLGGMFIWKQYKPEGYESEGELEKDMFYLFGSYIVQNNKLKSIKDWIRSQDLKGRWLSEGPDRYDMDLGQFPWLGDWMEGVSWGRLEKNIGSDSDATVLVSGQYYHSSDGESDFAREGVHLRLPNTLLASGMNLRVPSSTPNLLDKTGGIPVFANPLIGDEDRTNILLVRKDKMLNYLGKNNYSIVWTLLWEKVILAGFNNSGIKTGGRLLSYKDGNLICEACAESIDD